MKYFVSYTTRDKEITIGMLRAFSEFLKKSGEVFIDIIDNNSMDKQNRVIAELDSSDILLLIETKSTYFSTWVIIEIERATLKQIPIRKISFHDLNQIISCEKTFEIRNLKNN
jgi:hypothetical protein